MKFKSPHASSQETICAPRIFVCSCVGVLHPIHRLRFIYSIRLQHMAKHNMLSWKRPYFQRITMDSPKEKSCLFPWRISGTLSQSRKGQSFGTECSLIFIFQLNKCFVSAPSAQAGPADSNASDSNILSAYRKNYKVKNLDDPAILEKKLSCFRSTKKNTCSYWIIEKFRNNLQTITEMEV